MSSARMAALAAVLAWAGTAAADTEGSRLGVGAIAGSPSGATAQVRFDGPRHGSAINLALGLDVIDDNGLYVHADYAVSVIELFRSGSLVLPVYLGGGLFLRAKTDPWLGARVPLGIRFDLRRTRVHLFAETVLRFGLAGGGGADIRGAVGVRYFF